MPQGACSVASCLGGRKRGGEEEVGDGEDGAARIAAFRSVGEELFEVSRRSDAGFLLEPVDEVGVDVLTPVVYVEQLCRGGIAAAGEQSGAHRAAQQQGKHAFFHGCIAPFRRAASRRFSSRD